MFDVSLTVTLSFKAPILTKSTSAGSIGIDAPFARDSSGKLVIPRTLIKGKLWQSFTEQEELGIIEHSDWAPLLGSPADSEYAPRRGLADFFTFKHDGSGTVESRSYRIRIDESRGAVEHNMLMVIESPFAAGSSIEFEGRIAFYAADTIEADLIERRFLQGFRFLTSIGAEKSIGFGELIGVDIRRDSFRDLARNGDVAGGDTIVDLVLKPLAPFCLTRDQVTVNLFESGSVIPGAVIKGCFAATWLAMRGVSPDAGVGARLEQIETEYPDLCRNFERVRFAHAFPSLDGERSRPVAIPLSLAADTENRLHPMHAFNKAVLLGDSAPAFSIDWKADTRRIAAERYGWNFPESVLEVRNKHDRGRRKAEDENLFAYQMVLPDKHEWLSRVDFSGIHDDSERERSIAQFLRLLSALGELRFFSKTKARLRATVGTGLFEDVRYQSFDSGLIAVCLQTPALICDPDDLDETAGERELSAAYNSYWNEISNGSLVLSNYFARQKLVGGKYISMRFGRDAGYVPFLLTDTGSVFVFDSTDAGTQLLSQWCVSGLPMPGWVRRRHGISWRENPYLTENGFGEIRMLEGEIPRRNE